MCSSSPARVMLFPHRQTSTKYLSWLSVIPFPPPDQKIFRAHVARFPILCYHYTTSAPAQEELVSVPAGRNEHWRFFVMDYAKESLKLHREWKGKIRITAAVPVETKDDLSLAYTPGGGLCYNVRNKRKAR